MNKTVDWIQQIQILQEFKTDPVLLVEMCVNPYEMQFSHIGSAYLCVQDSHANIPGSQHERPCESAADLGAALLNAFDVNPACEVAPPNLYQCRRRLFFLNKCLQRYRLDTVTVS
ncbi:unnamed protein product [Cylicocyclus nassatus]|uniref:Uncharacterized protein n=1 Tax=Cylicocyclus nassatus TaxID=53992 RepID=A0AA36M4H3_CYLNA|nr:unnamed protein product [Cylicocyclus nassatus]